MTQGIAPDMESFNIEVNCVCLGTVLIRATYFHREFVGVDRSPFLQEEATSKMMKRYGRLKEIAYGVLFLASDESSFMTGVPLVIDGGLIG